MTARRKALIACVLLGSFGGCGRGANQLIEVEGQVLLDGKPLTTGSVITLPQSGRGAQGAIDGQGRFKLASGDLGAGAVAGVHRVAVVATEGPASFNPEAPRKSLVPPKYTNPNSSGLVIDVQPGQAKEVTLELSSKR